MHSQNNTARENPCRTEASDGTTDDECEGVLRDAADERPEFEDRDASEEYPFRGVEGVNSAVEELESTPCDHVGTCIPADVVDRVEDVSYLRNGCGNDCAVLTSELVSC